MDVKILNKAWQEYCYFQGQDKKMVKKINALVADALRNPFDGIGKPEPLRGNYSNYWSRRIDEKNRLIYAVEDDCIVIISLMGHYGDH